MKKSLLNLMAIAVIASSCSDNDNPGPDIKDEYIITGWDIKFSNEDDSIFLRFSYNMDGTVKQTKEWDKNDAETDYSFTYATYLDGKITKSEYQYGPAGAKETEYTYFYKDGKLAKINHHDGASIYYYDTLYYNAAGRIAELHTRYTDPQQAEWNNKKYVLTWTGNNVSKVEIYRLNDNGDGTFKLESTEVYTVDNKPNVFKNIMKDEYFWKTDPTSFDFLGENNVTKMEETEVGTTNKRVRTNTYTYDDKDKIVKFKSLFESFTGTTLNSSYFAEALLKYEKK